MKKPLRRVGQRDWPVLSGTCIVERRDMTRPKTSRREPKVHRDGRVPLAKGLSKGGRGKAGPRSTGRLQRAIDETVRREITAALTETGGNVVRAASLLGISQPSIYSRMAALAIDPDRYRR